MVEFHPEREPYLSWAANLGPKFQNDAAVKKARQFFEEGVLADRFRVSTTRSLVRIENSF
jgi:hypothetical protein